MVRLASLLALLLMVGGPLAPAAAQSDEAAAKRDARSAAREWLDQLADGDVEDSWETAAPPFRERTDRGAWQARATQLADSIGTPEARTLLTSRYREALSRAEAPGPFVVLTYRSRFTGGWYEELLLTMRTDEGWRVAGYRVTPLQTPEPPLPPMSGAAPGSRR